MDPRAQTQPAEGEIDRVREVGTAPDDRYAYLVYSDWLLSRGDRHGELIALDDGTEATRGPAKSLRSSMIHLLLRGAWNLAGACELHWRWGVVERMKMVLDGDQPALSDLTRVLATPACRFVRVLDVTFKGPAQVAPQPVEVLRALKLRHFNFPLRELRLSGTIVLGELSEFLRETALPTFAGGDLDAKLTGEFPALERLRLDSFDEDRVLAFLSGGHFPALRELRVLSPGSRALFDLLASARFPKLERLGVSMNPVEGRVEHALPGQITHLYLHAVQHPGWVRELESRQEMLPLNVTLTVFGDATEKTRAALPRVSFEPLSNWSGWSAESKESS